MDLLRIQLSSDSESNLALIDDFLGNRSYSTKTRTRLRKNLKALAASAQKAYQASVPVDTEQLINHIQIREDSLTTTVVYIDSERTYGSRNSHGISADELANYLDGGTRKTKYGGTNYLRTRASNPRVYAFYRSFVKGAPTRYWISGATSQFLSRAGEMLSGF